MDPGTNLMNCVRLSAAPPSYPFVDLSADTSSTTEVHAAMMRTIEPPNTALSNSSCGVSLAHNGASAAQGTLHPDVAVKTTLPEEVNRSIGDGTGQHRRGTETIKLVRTLSENRRVTQNRAAQRAFRERKERHLRDLETKLSALESEVRLLQSENEQLQLELELVLDENETFRGNASHKFSSSFPLVRIGPPFVKFHVIGIGDSDSDAAGANQPNAISPSNQALKGRAMTTTRSRNSTAPLRVLEKNSLKIFGASQPDVRSLICAETAIRRAVEDSHRSGQACLILVFPPAETEIAAYRHKGEEWGA